MAAHAKKNLISGVLTALGALVNDTDTLVGSALSVLGTKAAPKLPAFLTNNVSICV